MKVWVPCPEEDHIGEYGQIEVDVIPVVGGTQCEIVDQTCSCIFDVDTVDLIFELAIQKFEEDPYASLG